MLGDGLPQEVIALLRTIAVEPRKSPHLLHGLLHGLDDRWGQRPGHIPDRQLDDPGLRVGGGIDRDAPGYLRKQVAAGQLLIVLIDLYHGTNSFVWQFLRS